MDALDPLPEHLIRADAGRRRVPGPLVVGGAGGLEQSARLADVALPGLLRLDERVDVHRVSAAKKTVYAMIASNRCSLFRVDGLFTHHHPSFRGAPVCVSRQPNRVAGSVDPG